MPASRQVNLTPFRPFLLLDEKKKKIKSSILGEKVKNLSKSFLTIIEP